MDLFTPMILVCLAGAPDQIPETCMLLSSRGLFSEKSSCEDNLAYYMSSSDFGKNLYDLKGNKLYDVADYKCASINEEKV